MLENRKYEGESVIFVKQVHECGYESVKLVMCVSLTFAFKTICFKWDCLHLP